MKINRTKQERNKRGHQHRQFKHLQLTQIRHSAGQIHGNTLKSLIFTLRNQKRSLYNQFVDFQKIPWSNLMKNLMRPVQDSQMLVTPLSIILWRETQIEATFRRAFAWPLPSRPKKLAPLAKKLMRSTCSYVYQVETSLLPYVLPSKRKGLLHNTQLIMKSPHQRG